MAVRPTQVTPAAAPATADARERTWARTVVLAVAATILLAAVAFRLERYFAGRSLWLDESLLAINLLDRPLSRLADPLDLSQGAPFGFLATSKLAILALGKSELALRLLPLLASIATLLFAAVVARRVTWGAGGLLALALLAVSAPLLYYAAEFKQYGVEVAAVAGLTAVAIPAGERLTSRRYLVVAAVAAALLWFAYTTVFFVTAFALVYGLAFVLERRWRDLVTTAAGSLAWLASGLAVYTVSYSDLGALEAAVETATGGGGSGDSRVGKLAEGGGRILAATTGVADADGAEKLVLVVAFLLCVAGVVTLLRSKPYACLMLGLPIVLVFGGVAIGRYPVFERTMLVCVPGAAILIGHGAAALCRRIRSPAASLAVGAILAAVLLTLPLKSAIESIGDPTLNNQGQRPLLEQLVRDWRPGDTLHVHYAAQYALRYYAECDCLGESGSPPLAYATRTTIGRNLWHNALRSWPPKLSVGSRQDHAEGEWDDYLAEVERLAGRPRVWVLTSHWESPREARLVNEQLPERLDELGRRLAVYEEGTGRLLLYDLSRR